MEAYDGGAGSDFTYDGGAVGDFTSSGGEYVVTELVLVYSGGSV